MTLEDLKRILLKYPAMTEKLKDINKEIEETKERREALREFKAVYIDGMPHGSGISDSTYQKAEKIVDQFDRDIDILLDEIDDIQADQTKIGKLLRDLTPDEYKVIEAKYLSGIKWDFVPAKVNLSRRSCFYIHDRAISKMISSL